MKEMIKTETKQPIKEISHQDIYRQLTLDKLLIQFFFS
ncbi:hypothetical protein RV18_GL003428 [Enterococcus termitis]|nr:hypothetical protein RV18_GL003428 [Enterococcus termitis]